MKTFWEKEFLFFVKLRVPKKKKKKKKRTEEEKDICFGIFFFWKKKKKKKKRERENFSVGCTTTTRFRSIKFDNSQ